LASPPLAGPVGPLALGALRLELIAPPNIVDGEPQGEKGQVKAVWISDFLRQQ
jgi:hypothetical protein